MARQRPPSLALLLVGSLAVSAAVAYVGSLWFGGAQALAHALELVGSFLLTAIVFAAAFKFLPAQRLPWSDVVFGAVVTAILFGIGKFLIGLYLGKSTVASDFGAAGTLVVAIVWVYYSSQIIFFGAELTRAYATDVGSQKVTEAANSEFGTDEAEMIARAHRIVGGRDPAVAPLTTKRA